MRWRTNPARGERELGEVALFQGLRTSTLRRIDSLCTEIFVRPGRVLTVEGTPARQAFVIRSGLVSVHTADGEYDALGDGSLVGEMAFVYGVPRCATTTVLADTRLLVFNPSEFRALLDEPVVRERVLHLADARRQAMLARSPDVFNEAAASAWRLVTSRADQALRSLGALDSSGTSGGFKIA